jgi:RNA-binding protein 23/39
MRVTKPADPIEQQQEQIRRQTKVVVSGLVDKLAEISEKDLKELFEPFGEIDYVDIHRDPQTGQCKGYAFIQYVDPEKAKVAAKEMNNLTVTGNQKITVQIVTLQQKGDPSASGGEFLHSAGNKQLLMNSLAGQSSGPSYSNLHRPPISTVTTPYLIMTGMFKMEGTTPAYFDNLKRDVQKQAEEFGVIERVFIEKNNQGNVWIKYSDTASASKAQAAMNGKFFDNHKIFMYFVTETTYQTRVGI